MRAAHAAELQICVHAIGDAPSSAASISTSSCSRKRRAAITGIASNTRRSCRPRRSRGSRGSGSASRPSRSSSTRRRQWLHRRLGAARARDAYPLRALLDAGVVVGGASDAPVESLDVLHAIQCCVTREGFEPQQALHAARSAAPVHARMRRWIQFEEAEKGSLAAGKRADLVVLSRRPARRRARRASPICACCAP